MCVYIYVCVYIIYMYTYTHTYTAIDTGFLEIHFRQYLLSEKLIYKMLML